VAPAIQCAHTKVEWSTRTATMRTYLDDLYAKFREALRQSLAAK